jgi:hypothetical protein
MRIHVYQAQSLFTINEMCETAAKKMADCPHFLPAFKTLLIDGREVRIHSQRIMSGEVSFSISSMLPADSKVG